MKTTKAEDLIEARLTVYNRDLSKLMTAEVIVFKATLTWGVDSQLRNYIEDIKQKNREPTKLCVMVETEGGYIEIVERIYSAFRKHYDEVVFIVPNYAYSAGTVLVLSGDEIYMDYYSVLGPIDPQFETEDGGLWTSGIGYLHKFNELVDLVNADKTGTATKAQLAYLIKKFDPAKLFHIEQARNYSKALVGQWLPKHKFKNWTITQDQNIPVDAAYKKARADDIAEKLAEPKRWHSHGRGIGIGELKGDDIKLQIENFGDNPQLNATIRGYYDLFVDYCEKQKFEHAIHGISGMRSLS